MRTEPAFCKVWLRHVQPMIHDRLAEGAFRIVRGDKDAHRALQELVAMPQHPTAAERIESHGRELIFGVFVAIVHLATEAWRREHRGDTAGPGKASA
jgi:hypothetical protein